MTKTTPRPSLNARPLRSQGGRSALEVLREEHERTMRRSASRRASSRPEAQEPIGTAGERAGRGATPRGVSSRGGGGGGPGGPVGGAARQPRPPSSRAMRARAEHGRRIASRRGREAEEDEEALLRPTQTIKMKDAFNVPPEAKKLSAAELTAAQDNRLRRKRREAKKQRNPAKIQMGEAARKRTHDEAMAELSRNKDMQLSSDVYNVILKDNAGRPTSSTGVVHTGVVPVDPEQWREAKLDAAKMAAGYRLRNEKTELNGVVFSQPDLYKDKPRVRTPKVGSVRHLSTPQTRTMPEVLLAGPMSQEDANRARDEAMEQTRRNKDRSQNTVMVGLLRQDDAAKVRGVQPPRTRRLVEDEFNHNDALASSRPVATPSASRIHVNTPTTRSVPATLLQGPLRLQDMARAREESNSSFRENLRLNRQSQVKELIFNPDDDDRERFHPKARPQVKTPIAGRVHARTPTSRSFPAVFYTERPGTHGGKDYDRTAREAKAEYEKNKEYHHKAEVNRIVFQQPGEDRPMQPPTPKSTHRAHLNTPQTRSIPRSLLPQTYDPEVAARELRDTRLQLARNRRAKESVHVNSVFQYQDNDPDDLESSDDDFH